MFDLAEDDKCMLQELTEGVDGLEVVGKTNSFFRAFLSTLNLWRTTPEEEEIQSITFTD